MRDTSLPLTTPLPDVSAKFDLEFNTFTKSVNEIVFGVFCLGFCFFIKKIPSEKLY
tara:strand:+ start:882 stop:1049 length:168 start_codon:yes stop_codon:yes gene_type:complete